MVKMFWKRIWLACLLSVAYAWQRQVNNARIYPVEVISATKNPQLDRNLEQDTKAGPNIDLASIFRQSRLWKPIFKNIASSAVAIFCISFSNVASATTGPDLTSLPLAEYISIDNRQPRKAIRPYAYSVEMLNPPILQPRTHPGGEDSLLQRLSAADCLLLGEHIGSDPISLQADRQVELDLIRRMQQKLGSRQLHLFVGALPSTTAVQTAINTYEQTKTQIPTAAWTQLESTLVNDCGVASADLQGLQPIFALSKVMISPLAPAPAILQRAANEGLNDLLDEEKLQLVPKPELFVELTKDRGFQKYAGRVLSPLYTMNNGLIGRVDDKTTPAKQAVVESDRQRFVGAKMLKHEAMAAVLGRSLNNDNANDNEKRQKSSESLNIALVDQRDNTFGFGIEERLKRHFAAPQAKIYSVLLNPSASDSFSYTAALRLNLEYGEDELPYQRPLADFLWFGPADVEHMPSVKLLTRMKNAIGREGDKPPGEGSVLGVF